MVWQDKLFVDAALPSGLRSAPMIFNAVEEVLAFIVKERAVKWLDQYLDDFIVLGHPSSKECQKGLQAVLETCEELGIEWLQIAWSEWPSFRMASIAAKELLSIFVAAATWGPLWRGMTVCCYCDNQSVVAALRGVYCNNLAMAHMLRCLSFLEAKFNLALTAVHVSGVDNGAADDVSRKN